jgi:hypothetical protein
VAGEPRGVAAGRRRAALHHEGDGTTEQERGTDDSLTIDRPEDRARLDARQLEPAA